MHSLRSFGRPLRVLVVDGYAHVDRDVLRLSGVSVASDLYANMLQKFVPVELDLQKIFPADDPCTDVRLEEYDAVAWTGSNLTAYHTDDPRVVNQIRLQQRVFEAGLPSFGSCWGLQIATVASGGAVRANPRGREMGIGRKICLTEAGKRHAMFANKGPVFDALTSHNDEVYRVGRGATVLAGNAFSEVQAIHIKHGKGEFWGVQYHPEFDLWEMARLTECRKQRLLAMGLFKDESSLRSYVHDLEQLHLDPSRRDLRFRLGIDDDVINEERRCSEVVQWINYVVDKVASAEEHHASSSSSSSSSVAERAAVMSM